jgi:hypothetical protein
MVVTDSHRLSRQACGTALRRAGREEEEMASTIAVRGGSFNRRIVIEAAVALVAAGAITTAVVIPQTSDQVQPSRVAPQAATDAAGDHPIRSAMQELTDWAKGHGYAVAGSSPASSRFIPTTPWAAYESREFGPGGGIAGDH